MTRDVGPRGATDFEYDGRNRPTKITTPSGRRHSFTYNGDDSIKIHRVERINGESAKTIAVTRNFYTGDGRLFSSYTRDGKGKTIASSSYAYDANGNPTRRKTPSSDQEYAYDAMNRITAVRYANGADSYEYDAVGNRVEKNGEAYTYNALGELTSSPGGVTYGYDPQGRRISKTSPDGTESYAYDSLDQMTSRTDAAGRESLYSRDALGRLTQLEGGSLTRRYAYALGDSPIQVASAQSTSAGQSISRTESMTYGPMGLIESAIGDGAPKYPLADNSGTITAEIGDEGVATAALARDPFGELLPGEAIPRPAGAVDDPTLAFAGGFGRETLPESDLVKMGAREYDPSIGGFISRDPVTGPPSEPARRVAYAYALAGPARFSDLNGRSVDDVLESIGDFVRPEPTDPNRDGVLGALDDVANFVDKMFNCSVYGDLLPMGRVAKVGRAVAGGRKGAAVGRAGARTVPRNLSEKLALDEARRGAGVRIMEGQIKDPRYPENLWAKMQHVHKNPDGTKTVIHYWENLQTGYRKGFKFK